MQDVSGHSCKNLFWKDFVNRLTARFERAMIPSINSKGAVGKAKARSVFFVFYLTVLEEESL